ELVVICLDQSLLSARERSLGPSVVAVDRLRNVDPTELLDAMITDSRAEDPLPAPRKRTEDRWNVCADRLALGSRRAEPAGVVEVAAKLGIGQLVVAKVADGRHWSHPMLASAWGGAERGRVSRPPPADEAKSPSQRMEVVVKSAGGHDVG